MCASAITEIYQSLFHKQVSVAAQSKFLEETGNIVAALVADAAVMGWLKYVMWRRKITTMCQTQK